jgi:hypothetical protein
VQVSFAAPTAVAFEVGSRWQSATERKAETVDVVDISTPDAKVLWTSRGRRFEPPPPTPDDWVSAPVVVLLLQRRVDHELLRRQFGQDGKGFVVLGEETELVADDPKIDHYIRQLSGLLAARKAAGCVGPDHRLKLVFLTAMPVAFAAGWSLRDFRNDVEVLEFNKATLSYFAVDFGEGKTQ